MDFVPWFSVDFHHVVEVISALESRHVAFIHQIPSILYRDPRIIQAMKAEMVRHKCVGILSVLST